MAVILMDSRTGLDGDEKLVCPRCGRVMTLVQECRLFCENCGLQLDCGDKGWFW